MNYLFFWKGRSTTALGGGYLNEKLEVSVARFGDSSVLVCDPSAPEEINAHDYWL